jgi:hypothetical protein
VSEDGRHLIGSATVAGPRRRYQERQRVGATGIRYALVTVGRPMQGNNFENFAHLLDKKMAQ